MAHNEGCRRLGRPPVPEEQRGTTLNCYIPQRVVERLTELARGQRLTRNKLVGRILSDYVAAIDRECRSASRHLVGAPGGDPHDAT